MRVNYTILTTNVQSMRDGFTRTKQLNAILNFVKEQSINGKFIDAIHMVETHALGSVWQGEKRTYGGQFFYTTPSESQK